MKYMGSKRLMLEKGLGELLLQQSKSALRIVDLFCGAASVSWFAALKLGKPVFSCDLQEYASILAGAVVKRTRPVNAGEMDRVWLSPAAHICTKLKGWKEAKHLDGSSHTTATWRQLAQELCSSDVTDEPSLVWRCYGGHYYSPTQALSFDSMLQSLPTESSLRELCLAALIVAAGNCAASPGHTAQPFKATATAATYLRQAWLRDPIIYARKALETIGPLYATNAGETRTGDANEIAEELTENDMVFIDPPYSSVQYSRFYHVLESIARQRCNTVHGVGRYPPPNERPNSCYSRKSSSKTAIENLLCTLANKHCRVILTFPKGRCSNGLSGESLEKTAGRYFKVTRRSVDTRFSTLGGNGTIRDSRKLSAELILVLTPV